MRMARLDVAVLNRLRDEINEHFGFWNGMPRINVGPCGRFAKLFHEKWNARFLNAVSITFLMKRGTDYCYHVLIRLPDGRYYDGGKGVMSADELLGTVEDGWIEEMEVFDLAFLDRRSYGLNRTYRGCPNYSDAVVGALIDTCLDGLVSSSLSSTPASV